MAPVSFPLFSAVLLGMSLLFTGCDKKEVYQTPPEKNKEDYFDFKTIQSVPVQINYNFKGLKDYRILFEIYDENPWIRSTDGTVSKKELEPVFRAATDSEGKYSGNIDIPADIETVYITSDYPGTFPCVEADISQGGIKLAPSTLSLPASSGRATTPVQKRVYPDDMLVLGDWDEWGLPDYLLPEKGTPPAGLLYGIKDVLCGWKDIRESYPDLVRQNVRIHTSLKKNTKIKLVFLNSTASKRNVIGYYTYPTDTPPTDPSQIQQKIVAFPQAALYSNDGKTRFGALGFGDQIQLKYWDGTQFTDEFPAGISIGWFIIESGFNAGDIDPKRAASNIRYSDPALNSDHYQRAIALYDPRQEGDMIALGFEDAWKTASGGNFGDALFYLDFDKHDVIDSDLPPLENNDGPQDEENVTTYKGSLVFEDMWPRQGDYDMNDAVIAYECKIYKRVIGNQVYKIVDAFTPYHNGAVFANGFGYQLTNIDPASIKKVTITGPSVSSHMQGQPMEPGQEHPTFVLFDNMKESANKGTYTVTTEFAYDLNPGIFSSYQNNLYNLPPYNPFLIIESYAGRGKEVHPVNYPPTSLADLSLLGTEDDKSQPDKGLYYVSDNSFPFVLNLSGVNPFDYPTEGVRIDEEYPQYTGWVNSNGAQNKQWYKNKRK